MLAGQPEAVRLGGMVFASKLPKTPVVIIRPAGGAQCP